MMKRVNKKKIIERIKKGEVLVKCLGSLSSDYAYDKANNFGETGWGIAGKEVYIPDVTLERGKYSYNNDGTISISCFDDYYRIKEKE